MADGFRRRTVISVVASGAVLGAAGCTSSSSPAEHAFFSAHEAAVVEDATARIAPGPADDPAEAGHPGAREARVTQYIDAMLGALSSTGSLSAAEPGAPAVFAGGPWSNRHTSGPDLMTMFVSLDPVTVIAWRKRLSGWQRQYRQGVAALDKLAGGDFTKVHAAKQDSILAKPSMDSFLALLFEHTVEGMYSNPEYGGNHDLAGWKDISYPGDSQPRGYTAAEVTGSDGPDPVSKEPIVTEALRFLGVV
jgi:gluconate 2-dehydrogenase gamma chain